MKYIIVFIKIIFAKLIVLLKCDNKVKKKIGLFYYSFNFDPYFYFSDFESFGEAHNKGFEKLIELAKGKKIIFDVGAHIGLTCMPLSKVIDKDGKIYAFEPSRSNITYLQKHIKINKLENIELVPKLIGENNSEVVFYESPFVSAMNSIIPYRKIFLSEPIIKQQISLDNFCESNKIYPDIIKIDVEGAEYNILVGSKNMILKAKPVIVISVHPKHLEQMGKSVVDLLNLFDFYNYRVYDTDGAITHKLEFGEYILK